MQKSPWNVILMILIALICRDSSTWASTDFRWVFNLFWCRSGIYAPRPRCKSCPKSLDLIREAGFQNVTLDLIYAAPTTTDEMWIQNLQGWLKPVCPHISAYCLTIEENTVFGRWHKHQKMSAIDEEGKYPVLHDGRYAFAGRLWAVRNLKFC